MKQHLRSWLRKLEGVPAGWWLVLGLLPALVPLARSGFFESHDGLFHIYRLAALDRAVRAGVLYPRWFPEFAFGYGHPVLNFYGPLSYYWGLPFTLLGADAVLATKLVLATGLVASALAMYLFARLHLDRGPAAVAALVYAYLPYHLVDLYVRGALAEFLAFAWFPLILFAFHRLMARPGRLGQGFWLILSALSLVALVTTHSLSALIFAPVLAGYLLLLVLNRSAAWRNLALAGGALALALVLGAFYWLPVMLESGYVGLGHGASQGYQDHLVPLTRLFSLNAVYDYSSGQPAFSLGWVQVFFLGAGLFSPFVLRERRRLALFLLAVGFFSLFMLTTASLPVWRVLERGLAFLQYPWRFQAMTALASALLAGLLLQALPRRAAWLQVLPLGIVVVWALWGLPFKQIWPDPSVETMWWQDREAQQVGATWTGEYLPIWVEEQRWALSLPAPVSGSGEHSPAARPPADTGDALRLEGVGYTRYELDLDAPAGSRLVLHQFYYPGWQARWQGGVIPAQPAGDLGLAAFDLPPGSGRLVLRLAPTLAQRWGTLLSLLALLAAGVGLVARFLAAQAGGHSPLPGRQRFLAGLLAVGCLLPASVLLGSLALPNGYLRAATPVRANLENAVGLQGFAVDQASYRPGDTVQVTVYWLALAALDQDYKAFVHLTDADVTSQPIQHDGDPGGGFTPTTRWLPGEIVPDTHLLTLPANLPAGTYRLWTNLYEFPTVRTLTILSSEAPTDGRRILLGEIQVVAP